MDRTSGLNFVEKYLRLCRVLSYLKINLMLRENLPRVIYDKIKHKHVLNLKLNNVFRRKNLKCLFNFKGVF